MDKLQNAKYNMYEAVLQACNRNSTVWQTLQAFANAKANLDTNTDSLESLFEEQETIITGYAVEKKAALDDMTDKAMVVKGGIQAYANDTSNPILFNNINFSPSKLKYARGSQALSRAGIIYQAGVNNLANLANYGITQTMLDELQISMGTFNNLLAQPKDMKGTIAVVTAEIKVLVKATDIVIEKTMDKLMDSFKATAPDFYAQYFANRKTIDPVRTTALQLFVLNQDNVPVTDGDAYILGTSLSQKLNIKGFAMIGGIPFGTHSVSLATPYGTFTYGAFIFVKSKTIRLHVKISTDTSAPVSVTSEETITSVTK